MDEEFDYVSDEGDLNDELSDSTEDAAEYEISDMDSFQYENSQNSTDDEDIELDILTVPTIVCNELDGVKVVFYPWDPVQSSLDLFRLLGDPGPITQYGYVGVAYDTTLTNPLASIIIDENKATSVWDTLKFAGDEAYIATFQKCIQSHQ